MSPRWAKPTNLFIFSGRVKTQLTKTCIEKDIFGNIPPQFHDEVMRHLILTFANQLVRDIDTGKYLIDFPHTSESSMRLAVSNWCRDKGLPSPYLPQIYHFSNAVKREREEEFSWNAFGFDISDDTSHDDVLILLEKLYDVCHGKFGTILFVNSVSSGNIANRMVYEK